MNNRNLYLDNLKVWLTVLVIFHHAGQAYGNGGAWAYTPSNGAEFMPWIWHFFSVNASFFMGLYFLISGYFVPVSYDKQGAATFIRKKFIRLGIPLLIMGGIISVINQRIEIAHMWFVESLLVFCLFYALIRKLRKPVNNECASQPTITGMAIVGLVMGVGSFFIRIVSPQDHWIWPFDIIPLPMEPAHYLQYVIMFVIGILARRFNWLQKMTDKVGKTAFIIGLLMATGICLIDGDNWWSNFVWHWFGIYESLLCIFISFGLIWLFRAYFNATSTLLQWCADNSYGAYVVHMLLMLGMQYALDGVWMGGGLGKFVFIGIASTIVSYGFAWMLRLIPGVKKVL